MHGYSVRQRVVTGEWRDSAAELRNGNDLRRTLFFICFSGIWSLGRKERGKRRENQLIRLVHEVTPQNLLLEEIRLILLCSFGYVPRRGLRRSDGCRTLMVIALSCSGRSLGLGCVWRTSADGRSALGARSQSFSPVEALTCLPPIHVRSSAQRKVFLGTCRGRARWIVGGGGTRHRRGPTRPRHG